MNKKRLITSGLSKEHNAMLADAFKGKYALTDATACFEDLIMLPADAIVINCEKLNEDYVASLNEVFRYELDTTIILLNVSGQRLRFPYVLETDSKNLTDTINAINRRYSLYDEYTAAQDNRSRLLMRIDKVIEGNSDLSFASKVATIEKSCHTFEHLTNLLENISELHPLEKVPYRCELNSVLLAMLHAHNLIDIDFSEKGGEGITYDYKWIEQLSASFKNHYKKTASKNNVKLQSK